MEPSSLIGPAIQLFKEKRRLLPLIIVAVVVIFIPIPPIVLSWLDVEWLLRCVLVLIMVIVGLLLYISQIKPKFKPVPGLFCLEDIKTGFYHCSSCHCLLRQSGTGWQCPQRGCLVVYQESQRHAVQPTDPYANSQF